MSAGHGILVTLDASGQPQPVPTCFVLDAAGRSVCVPVDLVKPKVSTSLGRVANLKADPRASLLVEHWDHEDWSALWWARATLEFTGDFAAHDPHVGWAVDELGDKHVQYANAPFVRMLHFEVTHLSGWSASSS